MRLGVGKWSAARRCAPIKRGLIAHWRFHFRFTDTCSYSGLLINPGEQFAGASSLIASWSMPGIVRRKVDPGAIRRAI